MTRVSSLAAASALATALLALSACGTQSVSADKVSQQVSSELAAKVGQKPDKVTCPELKAEKGEQITCALTAGGQTYDTAVRVTSVDGSNVKFAIKVADQPR